MCGPCRAAHAEYMRVYRATRNITATREAAEEALHRAIDAVQRAYAIAEATLLKVGKEYPELVWPERPEVPHPPNWLRTHPGSTRP